VWCGDAGEASLASRIVTAIRAAPMSATAWLASPSCSGRSRTTNTGIGRPRSVGQVGAGVVLLKRRIEYERRRRGEPARPRELVGRVRRRVRRLEDGRERVHVASIHGRAADKTTA